MSLRGRQVFSACRSAPLEKMGLRGLGSAPIFAVLYLTLRSNASSATWPTLLEQLPRHCHLSENALFYFYSKEVHVDDFCVPCVCIIGSWCVPYTNRERLLFIDQNTCFLVLSFRYQKLWKSYVKLRHLLANSPKVKQADKQKLSQREVFWTFL